MDKNVCKKDNIRKLFESGEYDESMFREPIDIFCTFCRRNHLRDECSNCVVKMIEDSMPNSSMDDCEDDFDGDCEDDFDDDCEDDFDDDCEDDFDDDCEDGFGDDCEDRHNTGYENRHNIICKEENTQTIYQKRKEILLSSLSIEEKRTLLSSLMTKNTPFQNLKYYGEI